MNSCATAKKKDVGLIASPMVIDLFADEIFAPEFKQRKLSLHTFTSVEDLFLDVKSNPERKYCFAFELTEVYPGVGEVNITMYYPRDSITGVLNSHRKPLFDPNLRNPDWLEYNQTFASGAPHFMILMTDFVNMMLRGQRFKELELAFVPMKTPEFKELPPYAAE